MVPCSLAHRVIIAYLPSFLVLLAIDITPSFSQEADRDSLPDNYLPFVLHRVNSAFVGESQFLEGFSVSINLPGNPAGGFLSENDLLATIKNQRITGTFEYPNGKSTVINYEIVNHRGRDEIYMKTEQGYFVWESFQISSDSITFVIDWWYCPPPQEADVKTLELAADLLADSLHWHQRDDRDCQDDMSLHKWSLFCALKYASTSVTGEYNHHNTAMQTVRSIIGEMMSGSELDHPLMDFNNSPETSHSDVLRILREAKRRIESQIERGSG